MRSVQRCDRMTERSCLLRIICYIVSNRTTSCLSGGGGLLSFRGQATCNIIRSDVTTRPAEDLPAFRR